MNSANEVVSMDQNNRY